MIFLKKLDFLTNPKKMGWGEYIEYESSMPLFLLYFYSIYFTSHNLLCIIFTFLIKIIKF